MYVCLSIIVYKYLCVCIIRNMQIIESLKPYQCKFILETIKIYQEYQGINKIRLIYDQDVCSLGNDLSMNL